MIRWSNGDVVYDPKRIGTREQNFPCGELNYMLPDNLPEKVQLRVDYFRDNGTLVALSSLLFKLERTTSVKEIELIVPYLPASRQDKDDASVMDVQYVLHLLKSSTSKPLSVYTYDVHNPSIVYDYAKRIGLYLKQADYLNISGVPSIPIHTLDNICVICPDAGARERITRLVQYVANERLEYVEHIMFTKFRNVSEVRIADVDIRGYKGSQDFLIVDDICDGGATFTNIATWVKKNIRPDARITLYTTHGFYTRGMGVFGDFTQVLCRFSHSQV